MIKNYFKIAWRNLFRNKASSFINIGGLAIGMAVAILIGLWIFDELSFNRYHKNYDRIVKVMDYQGWHERKETNDVLPVPLGTTLRSSFGSDFKYVAIVRETEEHIIAAGDKKFTQAGNYMQPDAPEMFTLEMIHGSRTPLKDPNSILISQTLAKKLFGDSDPLDKIVQIDAKTNVKVTGVFKDLPANSEFRTTSFIAPFDLYGADKNDWGNYNMSIYAQLNPNADIDRVSAKIKNVLSDNIKDKESTHSLFLQPMSKWHLHSAFENHVLVTSEQMKFIWFYGIIGVFVLLLACINFMNLSTARSEKRAKEVGIRKAVGSLRSQLVQQFYGESLLISVFAFALSLALVQIILPWFNEVADKKIYILWTHPWFWASCLAFTFVTGLLAGSYPALYLSSFDPVKVLKGTFRAGKLTLAPRKVLVVVQFTVSVALIIGIAVVYRQIQYAKDRPVGYSQKGLITMQMKSPDFNQRYQVLKRELINTGVVTDVARANYSVTDTRGWNGGFNWDGKPPVEGQSFNTIFVTQDYGKTVGWDVLQGRDFSKELISDSSSIILNESAVKLAGLKDPVGQTVKWEPGWHETRDYKIIGVVKDMVKGSPFKPTYPSVIFLGDGNWLFAKINPNTGIHAALTKIEAAFKRIITSVPFDYKFVDEEYSLKFAAEERISKLATFFTILAIFISCMGLFGLASYVAEQRTKEIGVRKVLGASVFNLWSLLSKDFVILVIISCFIAIPVAWYFLNNWLQKYEYRIHLSWWVFAAAAVSALLITLLTVSFQAIKAAVANPIKSLRTE
jgi:putative ABC transport system permease protein